MKNNLAFVFPGHGSHKIGMLSELAAFNSIVEDTFSQASENDCTRMLRMLLLHAFSELWNYCPNAITARTITW